MTSFAYGIYGLHPGTTAHVLGYSADQQATDNLLEVWDGDDSAFRRFQIAADGDMILRNSVANATTATVGFVFLTACAGAPTGVPTNAAAGAVPLVYDTTNDRIYAYNGGWVSVALT